MDRGSAVIQVGPQRLNFVSDTFSWSESIRDYDHGYIIVTDNATGQQWISQAGPDGQCDSCTVPLLLGTIEATTEAYGPGMNGYDQDYSLAASFTTDVAATQMVNQLSTYSEAFTAQQIPYLLFASNSNTYAGGAWQNLTGSTPALPAGVDAPGWPGGAGW